jgi:hypothetical protein
MESPFVGLANGTDIALALIILQSFARNGEQGKYLGISR